MKTNSEILGSFHLLLAAICLVADFFLDNPEVTIAFWGCLVISHFYLMGRSNG